MDETPTKESNLIATKYLTMSLPGKFYSYLI